MRANADDAREAFGFAAEANQKANSSVDVTRLAVEKMRTVFERIEKAVGQVFDLEAKTQPRPSDHRGHHECGEQHESALAQCLDRGRACG